MIKKQLIPQNTQSNVVVSSNPIISNLKVAILIIGNMRSYTNTIRNLELNLLNLYNCDIYVTTYNKRHNMKSSNNIKEEEITEENVRNVYGKYVKHVTIINQDTFTEPYMRLKDKHYVFNDALDRLFTIEKLKTLAYDIFRGECSRYGRHYDFIIKIRPDLLMNDKFIINQHLNDNQIIAPSNDSGGGFNDHIAYGKPKAMAKYMTYYSTFNDIDKLDGGRACDVSFIEAGLRKYLEFSSLDVIRHPIRYTVVRDIKPQKVVFVGNGKFFIRKYKQ